MVEIVKKNGSLENYDRQKIINAINKSAKRVLINLSENQKELICKYVEDSIENKDRIDVSNIHVLVENALEEVNPDVAKSYKDYRNYKKDYHQMLEKVIDKSNQLLNESDHSNANADSELVSTKRSLIYKAFSKEMYNNFFLNKEEKIANDEGYIYIHDLGDRETTMNCCLFDMGNVLAGGFDLENMHYNEPTTISAAINVLCDVSQCAGGLQYGGFTIPEIDTILEPYVEKSYKMYVNEYKNITLDLINNEEILNKNAHEYAIKKIKRDLEQGFQSMEYNFNTVASSRGDFIFTTLTFGLDNRFFAKLVSETILNVRKEGQGKRGYKKPAIFPKLVFLYDKEKHGEGKELNDLYELAVECSSKAQYPDFLSLTGDGFVCDVYKKYHNGIMRWYLGEDNKVKQDERWVDSVISPMGCRAYLGMYYKNGGQQPKDENDTPLFCGRWNMGAISLNLPMIYMKSKEDGKDFFEVLEYYLQLVRGIHIKTKEQIGKFQASNNPIAYTQGGFLRGNLKPEDRIESLTDYPTISFGITALNELQELYNGEQINEDSEFAYKTLQYINNFANKYKKEDKILYAIYSTPAESYAYTQRDQFVKKYGVVGNVGKHKYFTNSYHVPVWTEINPFDKMDNEYKFFHNSNGGHIVYTRIPTGKNIVAIKKEIEYAMDKGFYFGVNIAKSYCNECGEQWDDDKLDECCSCGSKNITSISRVCGYLGFTRTGSTNDKQATRMNAGKLEEIKERKCM